MKQEKIKKIKISKELKEHIIKCPDCKVAILKGYIWSFELCLALEKLIKKGLVAHGNNRTKTN
jgi:hypothetical protein